jgi:iron(III) transport system substrate-binding protein
MSQTLLPRVLASAAVAIATLPASAAAAEALVVYSARNEQLIKPVLDAYTRETGVEIRFTTGDAAVLI